MIAFKGEVLNFACLFKSSETDVIILVEIGLINWKDRAISLELPEPGSFLGIDDLIFSEHDKQGSIKISKSCFHLRYSLVAIFLTINVWEKN